MNDYPISDIDNRKTRYWLWYPAQHRSPRSDEIRNRNHRHNH